MHGDIGQDLAIELDSGLFESIDQLRIARAVQLSGGRDAHDPQRAELALLLTTADVGELQAALHGFLRRLVELGFGKEITAGAFENLLAAVIPLGTAFYAGHSVFSICVTSDLFRRFSGWRQEALPGCVAL